MFAQRGSVVLRIYVRTLSKIAPFCLGALGVGGAYLRLVQLAISRAAYGIPTHSPEYPLYERSPRGLSGDEDTSTSDKN